jgi:ABC-type transport system involved in multi-copper enzyme maturation permease subunit
MGRLGLILAKDLREGFGQRSVLFRVFLGTALMPVAMALLQSGTLHEEVERRFVFSLYLLLFAFTGSTVAIITAAAALAGEKERRTAEALLAAPVSDGELFVGKALAAWLPGALTGYLGQALFLATWWVRDPWPPGGALAPAQWAVALVSPPLMALVVAALGLIVSARSATVLAAMQLSALLSSPAAGVLLWLGYRAMTGGPAEWITYVAANLAAGLALGIVGVRLLNREAIVMRL